MEGRKDCADFVNALLKNVPAATHRDLYSTDPLKVFDAVSGQGGFFLAAGQGASGYAWGSCDAVCSDSTLTWDEDRFRYTVGLKAENLHTLKKVAESAISK